MEYEEEEFVVVGYEDCSVDEEKLDSSSITSNNTFKNILNDEEMNTIKMDDIFSLNPTSDNNSSMMDEVRKNVSEENLHYDEMIEKAEEVVNNILKNIPEKYLTESDDNKSNDVIEKEHQPDDEFSIFSKNNIEIQNDKETDDIFVSDPKPTTTHYVTESIIPDTNSPSPALENFVENISDNIIDTSTDIATKITDQTKDSLNNTPKIHETDIPNFETTNYTFENNKPEEISHFYDETPHDNVTFSQPPTEIYNHDIYELKKLDEGVNETFDNKLFDSQQLLSKSNDFFNEHINEIPTNINNIVTSQFDEVKNIKEPSPSNDDIKNFYTFDNHFKEEEEEEIKNDMLEFSSTDDQESDDKNNSPIMNDSFEKITLQQTMYSPSIHDEKSYPTSNINHSTIPEYKMTDDDITNFDYPDITQKNNHLINQNEENDEFNEQNKNEKETFDMNNIPSQSVPKESSNLHDNDKSFDDPSNGSYHFNTSDDKKFDKTSEIFSEISRDDKDHSFNHSPEGGLHTVVDDILDRINAAASTGKHTIDQEISPVVEENESNESPVSQNTPVTPDIIEKYNNEEFDEEETPQRNGPLTIPHEIKNNDVDKDFDSGDIPKEPSFVPRPPTPPKDLNDDEYQPEVLNLGPPPPSHHFSTSEPHKPILKTAYHHDKAWVDFKTINPKVMDILYWRDPKKSGIAFSLSLLVLLLLTKLSVISLFAYASLLILTTTLGFRLFKAFEAKVKSGDSGNPFNVYLNEQFTIPSEKVHAQVDVIVEQLQVGIGKLQKLFLIENICESVKFVGICWALTYVGGWFSLLGLSFIILIGAFTLPKFYEVYQEPIDAYLKIAKEKIHEVTKQIEQKAPCITKLCGPCTQNAAPVEPEKKDQ
ncbi:Reticulon-2 [Strongyloides ratti]|uniref:Reticulon-like protein n=1 Tax=Strongyloides ratti TaxID=34506 RepID=A0A090LHC1_STRRB|nr:Reticulon-2 [Strongyloides ratti]CEF69177.1 Reticulon-2 [Strongyloides ratti]